MNCDFKYSDEKADRTETIRFRKQYFNIDPGILASY